MPATKSKKLLIIQQSKPGTGSTLAANIVWGLLAPESPIRYIVLPPEEIAVKADRFFPRQLNLVKTHTWDIVAANELFRDSFDVIFLCTERGSKRLSESDRALPNVVTFRYHEILVTENNSIENVVRKLYSELSAISPVALKMSIPCALKRVADMNVRYEEIKSRPFSYVEKFYHLHGSHRGRWKGE